MSPSLQEQLQRVLGNAYLLERELGGGGMSHVFLALETALDRRVVVKVLLPNLAAGVNVDRFRREIQLAAQLQHPHIVPLLAAGEADGLPYFVMPFVVGESLRGRLAREGELPVAETVRILRDVVSALAHAHAHGVVHRDVKPDNVLLSGGVAVVTDFGVAKAVTASSGGSTHAGLTSLGIALGTPAYMAPEQATGSPLVDHRADIYALGAMAFEMLTGQPPFAGRSAQAVLAAQVVEDPEPVERRRPVVPPSLAALVNSCLAKRPADRPQSAAEVLHLLDTIVTPSGGVTPTTAVRVHPGRAASQWWSRWPLVAALAAVVLIGAGVLWLRPERPPAEAAKASTPPAATPLPSTDSAVPPQRDTQPAAVTEPPAPPTPTPRPDPARPRAERNAPVPRSRARPAPETEAPPPAVEPPATTDSAPPALGAAPTPRPGAPPAPTVPAETVPTAVAPPAPVAPPPAPAAPKPPADPRPEIRSTLADYAAAIEAESVPKLRQVYPGMTDVQQRGWEQFFQLVRQVKAELTINRLDVSNTTAEADVSGAYTYLNTSTERTERQPVSFHATLRREDGRWLLAQVR